MRAKIYRIFCGEYAADIVKLQEKRYIRLSLRTPFYLPTQAEHGFGRIKGATKKIGNIFPRVQVTAYQRETGNKIWHTYSDKNGQYAIRNLAIGLTCFVVALDPNREYNAVISDGVVAK